MTKAHLLSKSVHPLVKLFRSQLLTFILHAVMLLQARQQICITPFY